MRPSDPRAISLEVLEDRLLLSAGPTRALAVPGGVPAFPSQQLPLAGVLPIAVKLVLLTEASPNHPVEDARERQAEGLREYVADELFEQHALLPRPASLAALVEYRTAPVRADAPRHAESKPDAPAVVNPPAAALPARAEPTARGATQPTPVPNELESRDPRAPALAARPPGGDAAEPPGEDIGPEEPHPADRTLAADLSAVWQALSPGRLPLDLNALADGAESFFAQLDQLPPVGEGR